MKKKKTNYNFGGALSDLAPLLNMALPGVGTAASMVGLAATLAKAPTNYEPVRQNENPYGFKNGGPLDPPGKKKYTAAEIRALKKARKVPGPNIINASPSQRDALMQANNALKEYAQSPFFKESVPLPVDSLYDYEIYQLAVKENPEIQKLTDKFIEKHKDNLTPDQIEVLKKSPERASFLFEYGTPIDKDYSRSLRPAVSKVVSNIDLSEVEKNYYSTKKDEYINKVVSDLDTSGFTLNVGPDDYFKYNPNTRAYWDGKKRKMSFKDDEFNWENILEEMAHRSLIDNNPIPGASIDSTEANINRLNLFKNKHKTSFPYSTEFMRYLTEDTERRAKQFVTREYLKGKGVDVSGKVDDREALFKLMHDRDKPENVNQYYNAYMLPYSSDINKYKDGGMYQSGGVYPSGMDNQLSSDSYEVDYPGNQTDAKSYGPYQFDDNEVVDMLNQFVFSDEKDLGSDGLSPAEMVKPLKRAKGKAEKKLEKYPYDAEAKNTIMMSDMAALQVAQLQESKKPVNDKKYYKCGGKIKRMYAQGGPIEDIYQGILKLRPNAVNEYGENELRKMASTLYDSAYEANIPYQDYTAQLFQESGFSPDVVYGKRRSSAGAAGVTQLMPETAKRLGVNPADPYQAIPASAEEMSRIMNKNAKEGFGNDMSLAQQRYNAGGPSFRKFMKGSKQLSETEHYPKAIAKHKAKAFSAPQEEYTYQGYIDPELLSQYSVKALRNQVSPPRDNTAIAMRTNYQPGGFYDSPYAMDTTDLSQGNWALPPSTGILRNSTDLTPDYINLLKTSGQPQPSGMAFLNTQISKGLPNRRMDMEEIMTPLERGLVNDASRTPQNILSSTEVYDRAKSPAMATPSDVQTQDINDLMTNGPRVAERKEPGFTFGDALQGIEVLGAFRGLGRGPEIDPLYQMQTRQIDDAPIRRAQASAFNAAASNVNTSSASGRNAVLSNLYANRLRGETDALTQLATQNKQLAGQTEQFNLGQRRLTDDINARNRAAFDQAQSAAFQTVGNTGRAFNKKKQGAQALKYLEATYPDVFKLLMSKIS